VLGLREQGGPDLRTFWTQVDDRLRTIWEPAAPPTPVTRPPRTEATTRATGTVVGFVADAVTNRVLAGATVDLPLAARGFASTSDGAFVVQDLVPGYVWLAAHAQGYRTGYRPVLVEAGGFTPTSLGLVAGSQRLAVVPRHEFSSLSALPPTGARVVIRARDSAGAPLSDAAAWLVSETTWRAGTVDAAGRVRFALVAPGPVRLLVRAPGRAPYARDVTFLAETDDTLDVTLLPAARAYFAARK
jgi:uncharacterized surface anchored protein